MVLHLSHTSRVVSTSGLLGYYVFIIMKPSLFDKSALYQICVQGCIDPNWSDRFEGMSISQDTTGDGSTFTTLQGDLRNQAALAGVLNSLYELHLPVFLVKRASPESSNYHLTLIRSESKPQKSERRIILWLPKKRRTRKK